MSKRNVTFAEEADDEINSKSRKLDETLVNDSNEDEKEGNSGNEHEDEEKYSLRNDDIEGTEEGEIFRDGDIEITPFNMKDELEEGYIDQNEMYHFKKTTEIRDNWLDNIDWGKVKETTNGASTSELLDENVSFDEIATYKQMLTFMKSGESVTAGLKRLGGHKSLSASERLKMKKAGKTIENSDPKLAEDVTKLTELSNLILTNMGNMNVYQETYEVIQNKINEHEKQSQQKEHVELDMYADDFEEKEQEGLSTSSNTVKDKNTENSECDVQWEFKKEQTSDEVKGPYSTNQMNEWSHSGHFGDQVWVRKVGSDGDFHSSKRIDFELYL